MERVGKRLIASLDNCQLLSVPLLHHYLVFQPRLDQGNGLVNLILIAWLRNSSLMMARAVSTAVEDVSLGVSFCGLVDCFMGSVRQL